MALGALDESGGLGYGASDDAPMSDMPPADEAVEYETEEAAALAEAFPELAKDPARLDALKVAIQLCIDNAMNREGGGERPSKPPMMGKGMGGKAKAAPALVLAFGKGPKSKDES